MTLDPGAPDGAAPLRLNGANGHRPPPPSHDPPAPEVGRRRAPHGGYGLDTVEAVRQLVVSTALPLTAIAGRCGIGDTTVKNWVTRYGWKRPADAPPLGAPKPEFDPALRRERLRLRLYRALGRQLTGLERRARDDGNERAEKDARTLAVLAKTLETLHQLDPEAGATVNRTETASRDELDADLAERIARWAAGGEGA